MNDKNDKLLILDRIKSYYKFKFDSQLARFLGIGTNTLANWYRRNSINYELIITKCVGLDTNWLLNGLGTPEKEFSNLAAMQPSKVEEGQEIYQNAKLLQEIERLKQTIVLQEQTIKAQEQTIEVLKSFR